MTGRFVVLIPLLAGVFSKIDAAVLRLKDSAAIQGTILAEKRDQIVVDLGYTVLMVPRDRILQIEQSDANLGPMESRIAGDGVRQGKANSLYSLGDGRGTERSVREWVQLRGESVVQIRTPGGLGSGFLIHEDGFLVTNFHVIENESEISVEVYRQDAGEFERASYRDVRIVAMNKFEDLALLKIEDKGASSFAATPLGNSELLSVGDRVFAIGSPLGLERTVTEGILSTKTRQLQGELYLQTTTQINPGNSGGPLFNLRGEVIGVTNMKMTFGEGLGFAIPIESVKYFLNHRDSFAYDNDNPSSPYRYLEPPRRISNSVTGE